MRTTTRRRPLLTALAASALFATACGGWGDADVEADAETADTTALEAETTEPAPETTEPDETATGPVPPEPPADFTGDRPTIFTTFTDPGLIAQGVIFEPVCLETWIRSVPEAELPLFADPSTDESAFAPESLALTNELSGCLDVVYLGDEYAKQLQLDPSCVIERFVMLDLAAFVAEQGRDIDLVFRHLADTAAQCE